MKTLLLILLPLTCSSQCPDDFWSNAVLVHDTPLEIQVGPGVAYRSIVIERSDTTKTETWIIQKKGTASPPLVLKESINDHDARVTYSGVWSKAANQPWTQSFLNKDVSYTYAVNASATLTFTGKKVEVIAELRSNHGVAKIEVRQGTTVVDSQNTDMYKATDVNAPTTIYSKELPQGTYQITVSLASVSAGRDSMVLDGFKVFE